MFALRTARKEIVRILVDHIYKDEVTAAMFVLKRYNFVTLSRHCVGSGRGRGARGAFAPTFFIGGGGGEWYICAPPPHF